MNYFVIFSIFLVAVSADDKKESCKKAFHPENFRCCIRHRKTPMFLEGIISPDDFKECWDLQLRPPSCARDECIGEKLGYYRDGKIDFDLLTKIIEKNTENDPELQSLFKDKCLKADADISYYGMPNMCDLEKIKICLMTQALKQCLEWNDQGNCQEIRKLVEDCSSTI